MWNLKEMRAKLDALGADGAAERSHTKEILSDDDVYVVFDGYRRSHGQQSCQHQDSHDCLLLPAVCEPVETFRHGFPFSPTALAWDPIQKLLAIGDKSGSLRIVGGPGVEAHVRHEGGEVVLHARFLVNDGGLVTATADDQLHLTRPNHPGSVVEIIDNPLDNSKLLIAYESGLVVVWDLRARLAEW
ncbi:unnamed protein product, partial [Leptidea sinapis]